MKIFQAFSILLLLHCSDASKSMLPLFGLGGSNSSANEGGISSNVSTSATIKQIQIEPATVSIAKDTETEFTATAIYTDGSKSDVTSTVSWETADNTLATKSTGSSGSKKANNEDVSGTNNSKRRFKALLPGKTKVKASLNGITAEADFQIKDTSVVQIELPKIDKLPAGHTVEITGTAILSDGSKQNLVGLDLKVNSSNSNPEVDKKGNLTASIPGEINLTASVAGITANTSIKVVPVVLKSISIEGNNSLVKGMSSKYKVIAIYDDGSNLDITSQATFTIEDSLSKIDKEITPGLLNALDIGETSLRVAFKDLMVTKKISITAPRVVSLSLLPTASSPIGIPFLYRAMATFDDGTVQDVTREVVWESDNPSVITISNHAETSGKVTALAQGDCRVTANINGISASSLFKSSPAVLSSISISSLESLALGLNNQFKANGIFSDGSMKDITSEAVWGISGSGEISNISSGLFSARSLGSSKISVSFLGITSSTEIKVTPARLTSISITPQNLTLPKGLQSQFTATGIFSDGSKVDLTRDVTWSLENSGGQIGEIHNSLETKAILTSLAQGSSTLTAVLNGIKSTTNITISKEELVSLSLSLPETLASGLSGKLVATGTFTDGSIKDLTREANFTTSGNLFIDQLTGIISASGPEIASITASLFGKTVTSNISVTQAELTSIEITPNFQIVPKGVPIEIKATGKYTDSTKADLTNLVDWTGLLGNISKSNNKVFYTGTQIGLGSIRANYNNKVALSIITVSPEILVSINLESEKSIANGLSMKLKAMGTYSDNTVKDVSNLAIWTSSGKATVDNSLFNAGKLFSNGEEIVKITATIKDISASTNIQVLPAEITSLQFSTTALSLARGTKKKISITGTYTDGTTHDLTSGVSFLADSNGDGNEDQSVISINNIEPNKGEITAVGVGNATITANIQGKSVSAIATVTQAELVSISIEGNQSIANGLNLQLKGIGTFSDNSTQDITKSISWSLSGQGSISNDILNPGLFFTSGMGTVSIIAQLGSIMNSKNISVVQPELKSLTISDTNFTIAKGTVKKIQIMGILTDGSLTDLTSQVSFLAGSSGNASEVISISNDASSKGTITALNPGTATIMATLNGKSVTSSVTVSQPNLLSITVSPNNNSIPKGNSLQYSAVGIYSDGSNQDLTKSVSWNLSVFEETNLTPLPVALIGSIISIPFASISNVKDTSGLLTSTNIGSLNVIASFNGVLGYTKLTIGEAIVKEIEVTSPHSSISKGITEQFTAKGKLTDGTILDLTNNVSWISDSDNNGQNDINVLDISNATKGLSKATGIGTTTVSAIYGQVRGSKVFNVSPASIVSISLESINSTLPKGVSDSILARATMTDGLIQNITSSITFISDSNNDNINDTLVASVSNSPETKGRVTTNGEGTVRIIGSFNGFTSIKSFTVVKERLDSIVVEPNILSLFEGFQRQFTATGIYSDGSRKDITKDSTWISDSDNNGLDDFSIAGISNLTSSKGLITANLAGSSKITAKFGGITSNTSVVSVIDSSTIGTGSDPRVQIDEKPASNTTFSYETSRNIGLQTTIVDQSGNVVSGALVEFLSADENNALYSQRSGLDGKITGTILVSPSDTSIVARITYNGTATSKISIPVQRDQNGVSYVVLNILTIQVPATSSQTAISGIDTDNDGIPDLKDAYPKDSSRAFKLRYPSTGYYTLAFEDNYPNIGDKDLNDYVIYAVFEEDLNSSGKVVEVRGRFQHIARGAITYSHLLNLRFPSSLGISSFKTEIYDRSTTITNKGTTISNPNSKTFSVFNNLDSEDTLPWTWRPVYNVDPILFDFQPGFSAKSTIVFSSPVSKEILGSAPYDLFITVKQNSQEIHLPGKYITNGIDTYLNANGFPWGILVTGNFRYPRRTALTAPNVYDAYSTFSTWASSKGTKNKDWYLNYNAGKVYSEAYPSSIISDP